MPLGLRPYPTASSRRYPAACHKAFALCSLAVTTHPDDPLQQRRPATEPAVSALLKTIEIRTGDLPDDSRTLVQRGGEQCCLEFAGPGDFRAEPGRDRDHRRCRHRDQDQGGLEVATTDKEFSFKLGGRLQADYGRFDGYYTNNGNTADAAYFRRAYLEFGGTVYRDWKYQINFTPVAQRRQRQRRLLRRSLGHLYRLQSGQPEVRPLLHRLRPGKGHQL